MLNHATRDTVNSHKRYVIMLLVLASVSFLLGFYVAPALLGMLGVS